MIGFGDITFDGVSYFLDRLEEPFRKDLRLVRVPGRDGAVRPEKPDVFEKEFHLQGTIVGTDWADLETRKAAFEATFSRKGEQKLVVTGGRSYMCEAASYGFAELPTGTPAVGFTATLVCSCPYEAADSYTQVSESGVSATDRTYPVNNSGKAPALPIFVVKRQSKKPRFIFGETLLMRFDGNLKGTRGITGVFSRASIAYLDGVLVASGVPRYPAGLSGGAVLIEEAITNLLSENQSSVETGTADFAAINGATLSRDTNEYTHGSASLKTVTPGAVVNEGFSTTLVAATGGQGHSGSLDLKGSGTVRVYLQAYDATPTWKADSFPINVTLSSSWQRVKIENFVIPADANRVRFLVGTYGSAQAVTFYADRLQICQKAYDMSWHLGAATRAGENLAVPAEGVLSPVEGTIEHQMYITGATKNISEGHYILMAKKDNNRFYLAHDINNTWLFRLTNAVNESTLISVADTLAVGWHTFGVRWSSAEAALFIDGVRVNQAANPKLPSELGTSLYIGSSLGISEWANARHGELRISAFAKTDAQVLAGHQAGQEGGFAGEPYGDIGYDNMTRESDVLVLDCGGMVLQKNGQNAIGKLLGSFFELPAGEHRIWFSQQAGGCCDIEIKFRPRWF